MAQFSAMILEFQVLQFPESKVSTDFPPVGTLANNITKIFVEKKFLLCGNIESKREQRKVQLSQEIYVGCMWKKSSSHGTNWYHSVQIINPP